MDTNIMNKFMEKSFIEPKLKFDITFPQKKFGSKKSTKILINEYFSNQPKDYIEELEFYYNLNKQTKFQKYHIFVVCYNEFPNLDNLVKIYKKQTNVDLSEVSINFIINYTEREDIKKNNLDHIQFEKSVSFLLNKKKELSNINIIPKCFHKFNGGLARARKYGMDYSLYCISKLNEETIEESFIISNEGDTLDIPNNYIFQYKESFSKLGSCFIQGKVTYPEEVNSCKLVKIYCDVREDIHIKQGLFNNKYPFFDGIMPIGRNYGVHPRIVALCGGIDAIPLKGAEDDLTFGTDIYLYLGNSSKYYKEIYLITNPRREIIIVKDLLVGQSIDAKKMYEDFHEITNIYDFDWEYYRKILNKISDFEINNTNIIKIINQFYQWVFRTVTKNYFLLNTEFQEIMRKYRSHELGYWEKENVLLELYEKVINSQNKDYKQKLLIILKTESLTWFNDLIKSTGLKFTDAKNELNSSLK